MGGGGGGGPFVKRSPEELWEIVRKAEDKTTVAAFETELAGVLGALLGGYNDRDVETVRDRLDDLRNALEGSIESSMDLLFGGSVAKHTYVDGLSDIDSLVLINDTSLEDQSPQVALTIMEKLLRGHLIGRANVSHGRMAITVDYEDGMVIQLLPAVRNVDGHIRVPSSRQDGWSNINPQTFQEALTRRNQACGGKLLPTVKLAKAIIGQLPEAQRLSGYHIESLAIAAFRNYEGKKTTAAMLPAFFERARELIRAPIRDSTGQSVHVDSYLGAADSSARQAASHVLSRLARRMRNASAAGSTEQWRALFGLDQ